MSEKMLPCPVCGGTDLKDPTYEYLSEADSHWVACYDCGCCGPCEESSEIAICSWNSMPRTHALRWTKEPPKKPGWYWLKEKCGKRRIVDVWQGQYLDAGAYLAFTPKGLCKVNELDGEWAGPIPEPKELYDAQ